MVKIRDIVKPRDLPQSGTLSMSQIVGEFNKGNTFSSYYGAASGVPASPPMSVSDFYGKSDGFSKNGMSHPDTEAWIAGHNKPTLSRIANTNINTYFGVKYPAQSMPSNGSDPTKVAFWNAQIKDGVQGKMGTSVPAGSSAFTSFGTQYVTITGWVMASWSGTYWTLDGKTVVDLYDADGKVLVSKYLQDTNVQNDGVRNWAWRQYSMTFIGGTHPLSGQAGIDKMAKWIHGGCKLDTFRTTAQYNGLPTVSTIEYYLDFVA